MEDTSRHGKSVYRKEGREVDRTKVIIGAIILRREQSRPYGHCHQRCIFRDVAVYVDVLNWGGLVPTLIRGQGGDIEIYLGSHKHRRL